MGAARRGYLAVDLGASGGRVVAGLFDGRQVALEEVHRFDNGPVPVAGHLHWDLLRLWQEVQDGLRSAAVRYGDQLRSVGVDTWGVDFGLLSRRDELLGNPFHYRDPRTQGLVDDVTRHAVSREEIFDYTGLQFMDINTLYQLVAMQRSGSVLLESADTFLMMPDIFHWLLTGQKVNELTNATTTQFFNPRTGAWALELLQRLGLPTHLFREVTPPGTSLGPLRRDVAEAAGLQGVQVVLPGTHDTASAVMAVPARSGAQADWCYISSGTWSLMGAEVPQPVITPLCREYNFTNEGGVGGTTRLLKNIAGLWLIQECRRIWNLQGHHYGWDRLVEMAEHAEPLRSVIDPNDSSFVAPADMPAAIADFCRRTGQPVPETEGAVVRCALESLAVCYRRVLGWLEELVGHRLNTIHIVGGGVQNRLLCQMAADACGRTVVAGPVEATALGNVLMQAIACGDLPSIAAAREVVERSFPVERYEPGGGSPGTAVSNLTERWAAAAQRLWPQP